MEQLTKIALFCLYNRTADDLHFAKCLAEEGFSFMGSPETTRWLESHHLPIAPATDFPHPFCSAHERLHFLPNALRLLEMSRSNFNKEGCAMEDLPFIDLLYINLLPIEEEMRREGAGEESVHRKMEQDGLIAMRNALEGGRIVVPRNDPVFFKDVLSYIRQRDTFSPEKEAWFRKTMKEKVTETIRDYCESCNNYHRSNRIAEQIASELA